MTPNPTRLRLFLDTADADAWQAWLPTGLFYGVTTNPLLLQRAGVRCAPATVRDLAYHAVHDLGAHEVHVQSWGATVDALVDNAEALIPSNAKALTVIKLPITRQGIEAAHRLKTENFRITLTALYARHQAVTAAALHADYAAPYLGRIGDLGRDGHAEISAMQRALDATASPTRLLGASLRAADDLARLAEAGCDTFTVAPAIAEALVDDEHTQRATADFAAAVSG